MLAAIVLAAGNSSRMGRPKPLLEYGGEFFIERVCAALRSAGVEERVVVLGKDAAAIMSAWKPSGERMALNPEPDLGQLSSLRTGISAVGPSAEGFMVCLADQPSITPETYREVAAFWTSHKDAIVIPRCPRPMSGKLVGRQSSGFKRGHPIIIPSSCRNLCFEGPLDKGLHWVTHHPSARVLDLDVSDPGIIFDCDTPEDYERLARGLPR